MKLQPTLAAFEDKIEAYHLALNPLGGPRLTPSFRAQILLSPHFRPRVRRIFSSRDAGTALVNISSITTVGMLETYLRKVTNVLISFHDIVKKALCCRLPSKNITR